MGRGEEKHSPSSQLLGMTAGGVGPTREGEDPQIHGKTGWIRKGKGCPEGDEGRRGGGRVESPILLLARDHAGHRLRICPPTPTQRFHYLDCWSPLLGWTCDTRVAEGTCPQTAARPGDGPKLLLTTPESLCFYCSLACHRSHTCRQHAEALVGSGCESRRRQSWLSACCRQGCSGVGDLCPQLNHSRNEPDEIH